MSEQKSLEKKLIEIQKTLDYFRKNAKGEHSSYLESTFLLGTARQKMDELGMILETAVKSHSWEQIDQPTKNNPNNKGFVVSMNIEMTWVDTVSGLCRTIPWFAIGKHLTDPAMAGGFGLTYYKRYFIMQYFNIPVGDDDPESFKNAFEVPDLISQEDADKVRIRLTEVERPEKKFCEKLRINSIEEMWKCNLDYANSLIDQVENANNKR